MIAIYRLFRATRRLLTLAVALVLLSSPMTAENRIYVPQVRSLQAVVNRDWLSPAVMRLHSGDQLQVAFDELSHDHHRYLYHLERCEADWSRADEVFESDWLEGFNDNVIDDYEHSINTVVPYTHYQLTIPNDRCRLKMSGNYRLLVYDEDTDETLLAVTFMVTEQAMALSMAVTTNTDIDLNQSHQQLSLDLNYRDLTVTSPETQLQTVVMQNAQERTCRTGIKPTSVYHHGLRWQHCRDLIFDAGNEYRKFEILDSSHPTMGIEHITWDGTHYQAYPYVDAPRPSYLYDQDADGAFYIRNSDNTENDITSEYIWVNYRLKTHAPVADGQVVIDGRWSTEAPETYVMTYDEASETYTARILQKQGYYSYQYLWLTGDGRSRPLPSEGSFYQTENRYTAFVYYKGTGERTWRLVAYTQLQTR